MRLNGKFQGFLECITDILRDDVAVGISEKGRSWSRRLLVGIATSKISVYYYEFGMILKFMTF